MQTDWVTIGRLWKVRGIRGEILAEIDSSKPGREKRLADVQLVLEGRTRASKVEAAWWHQGRLVLKFVGLDSINDAKIWEGAEIRVAPGDVEPPEPGAYSYADLIGCTVEASGCGEIGELQEIVEFGSAPILLIKAKDGREHMVPFVRAYLKEVNVAGRHIMLDPPEGLLDL